MITRYCQECERKAGHKRVLGLGTFLMILLTGGIWILMILFYPKRCIICGNARYF